MKEQAMRAFETTVPTDLATTEAVVRDALGAQGFGIVSEIDVSAKLRDALGVERPALKILGACSPSFAHRALEVDGAVALLLPCNVVLEQSRDGVRVRAVDPRALMDDPRFTDLAGEVAQGLQSAIERVEVATR